MQAGHQRFTLEIMCEMGLIAQIPRHYTRREITQPAAGAKSIPADKP
jgi:hypothetical protein